jgi:hypothetical protein
MYGGISSAPYLIVRSVRLGSSASMYANKIRINKGYTSRSSSYAFSVPICVFVKRREREKEISAQVWISL